jgi:uncharacterized protein involved in type VI secretion and phage assembly
VKEQNLHNESERFHGVVIALVRDVDDPLKQGRIKVHFPWLDDEHLTDWVRIAAPMSGSDRGVCFPPELEDEALVAFEHGNPRRPIVIGFLWNGQDKPPVVDVQERRIKSKNGHSIRFIDGTPSGGSKGALVLEDAHGNRITMSKGKISINAPLVEINGSVLTLGGPGYRRVVTGSNNPI